MVDIVPSTQNTVLPDLIILKKASEILKVHKRFEAMGQKNKVRRYKKEDLLKFVNEN